MKKFFKVFGQAFKRFGMAVGHFNTGLLMVISFYLLVFPFGLVRRILGKRSRAKSGWIQRGELKSDHFEKQY